MGSSSSTMPKPPLTKTSTIILNEVKEHPVVIYSKDNCVWCDRAKNLLNENQITYCEKNLTEIGKTHKDGGQEYLKGLIDLTKSRTVPQLFVCGKFIGGYTEALQNQSNLFKLVEQCSVDGKTVDQNRVRASSKL